jgi:hypothetical protein
MGDQVVILIIIGGVNALHTAMNLMGQVFHRVIQQFAGETVMRSYRKLYGGAVLSRTDRVFRMLELLMFHVRDRLDLAYYPHAYDIGSDFGHDFIMVFSLKSLREVVEFYTSSRQPIPLLVHVNSPEELQSVRHQRLFPGVRILPIPQALFGAGDPDVTLDLSVVDNILESL